MSDDAAYEIQTVDRLIATSNHGDDCDDITKEYRDIIARLKKYQADYGGKHKASLTIRIEIDSDPKGLDVSIASSPTMPKRPRNKERYFASDRADILTLKDPARDTMFPGVNLGRRARNGDE